MPFLVILLALYGGKAWALLLMPIAKMTSFGLITGRMDTRCVYNTWAHTVFPWKCCLFCLNGLEDTSNLAGTCCLTLEVSPFERKALHNALDSGLYVYIWMVIRGPELSISLSILTDSKCQLQKHRSSILLQSPNVKTTSFSRHIKEQSQECQGQYFKESNVLGNCAANCAF